MNLKISIKVLLTTSILFVWFTLEHSFLTTKPLISYAASTIIWSYQGQGNPPNWGQFSAICSTGKQQSPIDITSTNAQDLTNIDFHYQPSRVGIFNNGRTVQVNCDRAGDIRLEDNYYNVKQFHYHSPSEHSIQGRSFPAELHLVHEKDGKYAVVGILLEAGQENPAYQPFIDHLPPKKSPETALEITLDVAELLPTKQTTYRYQGSLTTPPCTEGVDWFIMTTPVQLSTAQIKALTTVFSSNNRPIQPLGNRNVIEDNTL